MYAPEIPSGVTERECAALADAARGRVVLEVGSWYGRSTIALASTAKIVHAVDWHRGDDHAGREYTLPRFIDNLSKYGVADKVVAHVGRFEDVEPALRGGVFDFAFLDSFHERATVARHMLLIDGLMRQYGDGVEVAAHDYKQAAFGPELEAGCASWLDASNWYWAGPRVVDSTAYWVRGDLAR